MTSNSSVDQFIGDIYKVFWVAWIQINHLSTPVDSRWRRPASCIRISHLVADFQSKSVALSAASSACYGPSDSLPELASLKAFCPLRMEQTFIALVVIFPT